MIEHDRVGISVNSLPGGPDWEAADEEALIHAVHENAEQVVADLLKIAQGEHDVYYKSIGENPSTQVFGGGPWHDIYVSAKVALAEGVRLEKQQGEQNAKSKTATD